VSKGRPPAVPVVNHRQVRWVADRLPPGVTYRQLDWWARQGYVTLPGSGSGHSRQLDDTELWVAEWMGRLTRAGLTARVAARVARQIVSDPDGADFMIEPGLWLHLPDRAGDEEPPAAQDQANSRSTCGGPRLP
jgi:hypothetical protein